MLLKLLVEAFVPEGPLVVGIDETLQRRRGKRITAKGSTGSGALQSRAFREGQRSAVGVLDAPRADPVVQTRLALHFLSVLAPSERYAAERGKKRHKKLTDWARQSLFLVRCWWPEREIVAVADSGYAAIALLSRCARLSKPIAMVTRLRLDPRSTNRPHHARLVNWDDPATMASVCPTLRWWSKIRVPCGGPSRSPTGTAAESVLSRPPRRRRSGTTRDCRRYPCDGYWSVIRKAPSPPKPCSAPTWAPIPNESCRGSSYAENLR